MKNPFGKGCTMYYQWEAEMLRQLIEDLWVVLPAGTTIPTVLRDRVWRDVYQWTPKDGGRAMTEEELLE